MGAGHTNQNERGRFFCGVAKHEIWDDEADFGSRPPFRFVIPQPKKTPSFRVRPQTNSLRDPKPVEGCRSACGGRPGLSEAHARSRMGPTVSVNAQLVPSIAAATLPGTWGPRIQTRGGIQATSPVSDTRAGYLAWVRCPNAHECHWIGPPWWGWPLIDRRKATAMRVDRSACARAPAAAGRGAGKPTLI